MHFLSATKSRAAWIVIGTLFLAVFLAATVQAQWSGPQQTIPTETEAIRPVHVADLGGDRSVVSDSDGDDHIARFGNQRLSDLTDGLVAYYPFDGNANDESGNGHDGTVHGATLTTDRNGNSESAYSFDGQDDYIDVGGNEDDFDLTEDLTIAFWVKLGSVGEHNHIVLSKHEHNVNGDGSWWTGVGGGNGQPMFVATPQFGNSVFANSGLEPNKWAFVSFTYDDSADEWTFYLNGSEDASSTLSFEIQNTNKSVNIGRELEDFDASANLEGSLDDLRVYNRVLSGSEIQQLYSGSTLTAPVDLSASGGDGQVGLSWSAGEGSNPAGYNVYRSTSSFSDVANATKLNSSLIDGTSLADQEVTNGTTYYYRITAVDNDGNESDPSNEASATPKDQSAPSSPTILNVEESDPEEGKVVLDWSSVFADDLAGYNLYRSTASFSEVSGATKVNDEPLVGDTYTDTDLTLGTEYFYRVTAEDDDGNESSPSDEAKAVFQLLKLVGLEVNQSIQNWKNDVPLIEGKKTVVRAHLQNIGSDASTAKGIHLIGERGDGSTLGPLVPDNKDRFEAPPESEEPLRIENRRADLNRSLNFTLPPSWLHGTVTLKLVGPEIKGEDIRGCSDAPAVDFRCRLQVEFKPTATPEITFFEIHWKDLSGAHKPDVDAGEVTDYLKSMYPVSDIAPALGGVIETDHQPTRRIFRVS